MKNVMTIKEKQFKGVHCCMCGKFPKTWNSKSLSSILPSPNKLIELLTHWRPKLIAKEILFYLVQICGMFCER
jgi:hypothetical protein